MEKTRTRITKSLIAILLIAAMIFAMMPAAVFAAEAVDIEWYNFRNNPENNGVTDAATPNSAATATLKWGGQIR